MNKLSSLFMGDRVIWVVYFLLCAISLVEVFSAASTLAYKSGSFWDPLIKQSAFLTAGTIAAVIIHRVPCRMFKVVPIILYPISLILLMVTLFSEGTNEASRWIDLGFVKFQPSELAKGGLIIAVALVLSKMQQEGGADRRAFKYILTLTVPVCLLIVTENLSTAALLFGVVFLMMFIGRVPMVQLGKLLGSLMVLLVLFIMLGLAVKDSKLGELPVLHRMETWVNRITDHLESDEEVEKDPAKFNLDDDAQVGHANIAIASSNIIGKMPGNSDERDFLSQAFSDFIFAIIIEEMGIIGATLVVFLYIILLFRAGRISSRCERNFPPFLIMGLTLMLVSQAVLNMMVAVGLFPVTGQPLPLISRGGTSTIITCIYFGMILSVSRYARQISEPQHTRFDGKMDDILHEDDIPKKSRRKKKDAEAESAAAAPEEVAVPASTPEIVG